MQTSADLGLAWPLGLRSRDSRRFSLGCICSQGLLVLLPLLLLQVLHPLGLGLLMLLWGQPAGTKYK